MKSELKQFDFNGEGVRIVMRNGAPWFVAADVCNVVGITKHRDAITRLDDDERGSVLVDILGGQQQVAAISESGLYHLIVTSRTERAQPFRRWVTHEVLPALRRDGHYAMPGAAPASAREKRVEAITSAGRVFTTINKVARSAGVPRRQAAELANEAGVRETGIDLFEVGQIERHVPDVPSGTAITRDPWYEMLAEWVEDQTMVTAARALDVLQGSGPQKPA